MFGTVNKVILIGNIGKDPEIRVFESRKKIARFQLATSESYLEKSSGKYIKNTEWHTVVAWNELAEIVEKHVVKGQKLYIEGKLKNRFWRDQEGNENHKTEIYASSILILSPKSTTKNVVVPPDFNKEAPLPVPPPLPEDLLINDEDVLPF